MKRRHFDRSARGTSARSGEICCKTQAVWEGLRGIAGDSSTPLRSARNDGATPRHFDRSARRMSARSGEICCKTQDIWEGLRGIAGDSSTPLRFARNDGETMNNEQCACRDLQLTTYNLQLTTKNYSNYYQQ
jgi:hypothetical protein